MRFMMFNAGYHQLTYYMYKPSKFTIFYDIACYGKCVIRCLPRDSSQFHDLSLNHVPNVNYTWTHPEWNIDILRTFIVFWQDTSRDLCDLYTYTRRNYVKHIACT